MTSGLWIVAGELEPTWPIGASGSAPLHPHLWLPDALGCPVALLFRVMNNNCRRAKAGRLQKYGGKDFFLW